MNASLTPSVIKGCVQAPPSKSASHRLLIAAALSKQPVAVENISLSDDMNATLGVLNALGFAFERKQNTVRFLGEYTYQKTAVLDCMESGSTLRFFIPIAAALGTAATFAGHGRLPQRSVEDFVKPLYQNGADMHYSGTLPFTLTGKLKGGEYAISGAVSSQYITGLLLALPLLEEDSRIVLTYPLSSAPYVDMTLAVLRQFGVVVKQTANGFFIKGGQPFLPPDKACAPEGDYSNAAFWLSLGALGGDVTVSGLNPQSVQGDKAIVELLGRFGAKIQQTPGKICVQKAPLKGIDISVKNIPDLAPILAVVGAFASGVTRIVDASNLRHKESDRIFSTAQMLKSFGAKVETFDDAIVVHGGVPLHGAVIDSYNDHRIAMAASVAAMFIDGETMIQNSECVNKSYPDFYEILQQLGGNCHVVHVG